MATITMTGGFAIVPEGTHVFRIYNVDYDPTFGKLVVHMVTAKGIVHRERFSLMRQDGSMNEGACNKFSFFAKTALNDFTLAEIDHSDLVNHYIKCKVIHNQSESTKEVGKMVTFANIDEYSVANGFEETPTEKALTLGTTPTSAAPTPAPAPAENKSVDLASLLG